jgi:hypothetical protein
MTMPTLRGDLLNDPLNVVYPRNAAMLPLPYVGDLPRLAAFKLTHYLYALAFQNQTDRLVVDIRHAAQAVIGSPLSPPKLRQVQEALTDLQRYRMLFLRGEHGTSTSFITELTIQDRMPAQVRLSPTVFEMVVEPMRYGFIRLGDVCDAKSVQALRLLEIAAIYAPRQLRVLQMPVEQWAERLLYRVDGSTSQFIQAMTKLTTSLPFIDDFRVVGNEAILAFKPVGG